MGRANRAKEGYKCNKDKPRRGVLNDIIKDLASHIKYLESKKRYLDERDGVDIKKDSYDFCVVRRENGETILIIKDE